MYNAIIDRVHEYITTLVQYSGKTQAVLAKEMGFARPNFLTMLKQGRSRVPLERIPAIAKALRADPAFLLWMCLREYHPEPLEVIETVAGRAVTANEFKVVQLIRDAWGDQDPEFSEHQLEKMRRAVV